jgi:hypothetical protein
MSPEKDRTPSLGMENPQLLKWFRPMENSPSFLKYILRYLFEPDPINTEFRRAHDKDSGSDGSALGNQQIEYGDAAPELIGSAPRTGQIAA